MTAASTHLLVWAEDSEAELRLELNQCLPGALTARAHPSLLEVAFDIPPGARLPRLAFVRQWLPGARPVRAESIRTWADELFEAVAGVLPDDQPWSLHIEPHYGVRTTPRLGARAWHSRVRSAAGAGRNVEQEVRRTEGEARNEQEIPDSEAGRHRCRLIREAVMELLRKKRRHLLRHLRPGPVPFTTNDSLVQVLLTAPVASEVFWNFTSLSRGNAASCFSSHATSASMREALIMSRYSLAARR
jgi:hypothetical protein